ncbi:methyltransferase type 11 [Sulfitobacter sp. SK012]|uniref:class I SAM-dependent DNA methyltransferase n=1 Tax=Sulfitobacter sp. SK012 TaxID=1389005 RepID=UPI000E0B224E|nr:methyltransferase domain-containing protein [Sulfitobacter sp. SK012]AXI46823.1 methyltransferase type 11 [Sulfitobacter sp. SK012]
MNHNFLDKAYAARDADSTRALYDDWSSSYDAEIGEIGYATPDRCAAALAEFMPDKGAPILDVGCGTGLSGAALKHAGFTVIDGVDVSADMLALAKQKNVYRTLTQIEADTPLSHTPGTYAAISAVGVVGAGGAPTTLFDMLMQSLGPGGKLVFSLNDHALSDSANEARVMEWTDCAAAALLFREHGDHLPGIDLKSNVYVLEKR